MNRQRKLINGVIKLLGKRSAGMGPSSRETSGRSSVGRDGKMRMPREESIGGKTPK